MKKHYAIQALTGKHDGTMSGAARVLGCSPEAVRRWPVDEYGNILSAPICNKVLATLVRKYQRERLQNPNGVRWPFDEEMIADLVQLPEDEIKVLAPEDNE